MADDARIGDDATLLPEATPVLGDEPTAASMHARRSASASAVARVARYVLLDRLGEGGMGVVWSAYDPELDRRIAVKLIRGEADDAARQRFIREARAMAQLHHPAIVAIHDVGTTGEHAYIAMELVRGVTLRDWLKDDTRSWRTVLATFVRAGEGVAVAHRAGVVHRDFKPANVMVAEDGRAVVLDFGLARAPTSGAEEAEPDAADPNSWASIDVTRTAGVVGTPAYMAPEQIAGAAFDGRADQFAFCVAAYEALFGVAPFSRDSLASMVGAMAAGNIAAPVSTQRVPSRIRRALGRGLAYDPGSRWPDMDALLAELRRDRGRTSLAVGGGAVAIAAVVSWTATRPEPVDPCAPKDAEVAQVWTAERRAQVERVAAKTEVDGSTVAELDAYVGRLRGAVAQSCAASSDPASDATAQGRVGVCLDAARSELDGLLEVLTNEGAAATDALTGALWLLPDPSACIELADAEHGGGVVAAQAVRQLAEAESWLAAGNVARADELLAPLLADAEGAGPAWRSRVLRISGKLEIDRGNLDVGVATLTRAAALAIEGGDDLSFVRCAVDLAQHIGLRGGDFARGEHWIDLAMATARRLGGGPGLQARLLEARGSLRQIARDFDGSVLSLTAALAITMAMLGPEHRRTGEVLADLATTHLMDARHESALPLMMEARRILEATLGPHNVEVMRVRTNTLTILTNLGRYADAERDARELVSLLDAPDSTNPAALATALTGLAEVAHGIAIAAGDLARARAILDATAEPASHHVEVTLNHKLRSARLALAERKPGNHAVIVREFIEYPKTTWHQRVDALLLVADLERLAGDQAAVTSALDRARRDIGERDAPRLLREIEQRRKP